MAKVKSVFSACADELNKNTSIRTSVFKELSKRAVYRSGDISVWKIADLFYRYCFKNIVIMELTGISHDFLEAIINGTEFKYPYIIETARERISKAEEYAKEYGFKLESI